MTSHKPPHGVMNITTAINTKCFWLRWLETMRCIIPHGFLMMMNPMGSNPKKKQIQENIAKKSSFTFNQPPKESKLPNLPEGFRVCHFLLFPREKKYPGSARVCFPGGVPFLLSAGRHGFWMINKALKVNKSCKKRVVPRKSRIC